MKIPGILVDVVVVVADHRHAGPSMRNAMSSPTWVFVRLQNALRTGRVAPVPDPDAVA